MMSDYNKIDLSNVKFDGDPFNVTEGATPEEPPEPTFDPDELNDSSNSIVDSDEIITKENDEWFKKPILKIWDYVRSKIGLKSNGNGGKYLNEKGEWILVSDTRSYVGMVIHSTTFDTEAKVKAFYGGTTWIQHSGYFLRGASSGVNSNHTGNDGGQDNINLSHSHTVNKHSHNYGISFAVQHGAMLGETTTAGGLHKNGNANTLQRFYNTGGNASALRPNAVTSSQVESGRAIWASNTTTSESSPATNAQLSSAQSIIPLYKNVYIWERTE